MWHAIVVTKLAEVAAFVVYDILIYYCSIYMICIDF